MKRLLTWILARCGLIGICRRLWQRKTVTILVYHEAKPAVLRKHLESLRRHYSFVSLADYIGALEADRLSTLPDYAMVITLDDGHASNRELVGLFEEFGVVPTIFLTSGVIGTRRHFWWKHCSDSSECGRIKSLRNEDRLAALVEHGYTPKAEFEDAHALRFNELKEMSETVDFQAHTVTHPILTMCDENTARKEIAGSKDELEKLLGTEIYAFAYPNGSYGQREIEIVKTAGYKCALTVDPGFNTVNANPYELKRMCIGDAEDAEKALLKACGLWQQLKVLMRRSL